MIERIQTRRAALAAQLEHGRAQYDALEDTLKALDRQLCMIAGGLAELDALLSPEDEAAEASVLPPAAP